MEEKEGYRLRRDGREEAEEGMRGITEGGVEENNQGRREGRGDDGMSLLKHHWSLITAEWCRGQP